MLVAANSGTTRPWTGYVLVNSTRELTGKLFYLLFSNKDARQDRADTTMAEAEAWDGAGGSQALATGSTRQRVALTLVPMEISVVARRLTRG